MAEAAKTTNPRAARRTATTKTAPKAAEAPKATASERVAASSTEDTGTKRVVHLIHTEDTKSYSKWSPDAAEEGVTGTFYAPLGAETVRVLVVMPETK